MNINIRSEDIVHVIGLTLVLAITISFIEFAIAGRVSFVSLIAGLILATAVTHYVRRYYVKQEDREVSKLALTLALLYAFVIISTYYVYPIFPANRSADFLVYIERSIVFATGEATFKNLTTLHPAIYLLLGAVLSLNILNPLFLTRGFMLLLTILNIPLIYMVSKKLYGKLAGELALLLSIFINIFWYYTVIITGLYANFLGLMLALYLLYLIAEYFRSKHRIFLVLALPTTLVMLLSHETTFAVLLSFWLSSIYDVVARRNLKLVKTSAILSSPLVLVFLLAPASIRFLENFIMNYILRFKTMTLRVMLITPVNPIYNTLKIISPMLANVYSSAGLSGLTLTILCLTYGLLLMLRKREGLQLILWFWVLILLLTSYFTMEAWRLALNALIPITIFSAVTAKDIVFKVLGKINSVKLTEKTRRILKYELAAFTIILLFVTSNISLTLAYNYCRISEKHQQQYGILEAMEWIKENTPENAKIASIARWQFMYLPYIANRTYIGDYALAPTQLFKTVMNKIKTSDSKYMVIIVWNKLHNETAYYLDLYRNCGLFEEIWRNSEVTVFRLRG